MSSEGRSKKTGKSPSTQDNIIKNDENAGENSSDSIKVICRFRPIRANAKKDSKFDDKVSYNLNESTGEVDFTSCFGERKIFKFDKVRCQSLFVILVDRHTVFRFLMRRRINLKFSKK
jgi:hypothetical protein